VKCQVITGLWHRSTMDTWRSNIPTHWRQR